MTLTISHVLRRAEHYSAAPHVDVCARYAVSHAQRRLHPLPLYNLRNTLNNPPVVAENGLQRMQMGVLGRDENGGELNHRVLSSGDDEDRVAARKCLAGEFRGGSARYVPDMLVVFEFPHSFQLPTAETDEL